MGERTVVARGVTARLLFTIATASAAAACGDTFGDPPDGPDRAPTIEELTVTTAEDTAASFTLVAADPDGDELTVAVSAPRHGTLAVSGLAGTYTPDPDFHGEEALRVTATAKGRTVSARLRIVVTPVNDAPVAADDVLAATEDVVQVIEPVALLTNDRDVDGDALTITAVDQPTHGAVALDGALIRFTPDADFEGAATFRYTVSDGAATDTATVTIQYTGTNDPPVAGNDVATTAEDTPLVLAAADLLANDTDPEGQTLSITAVHGAVHGTVALAGTTITFTPAPDFHGAAIFRYTVSDGALTAAGRVDVTVTPVNDAPVAVADTRTTPEDTALVVTAASLLANDLDVDGDPLTLTDVGDAVHGAVELDGDTVTFTPAPDFHGTASFRYTISDGALTATALVTVIVTPVNDPPVAHPQAVATVQTAPVAITLTGSDPDGDALTFAIATAPAHGTLTGTPPAVTYVPAPGHIGTDSFTFTAADGAATSAPATVTITITECGDGVVEGVEACDDGNLLAGDGCSATCRIEVCGDGALDQRVDLPARLELIWLATACGGPGDLTLAIDGEVVLTTEGDGGSCTCAPGIRTALIDDPDAIARLSAGGNAFTVSFPGVNRLFAWAVLRDPDGDAELVLFDHNGGGHAEAREPDLCSAGFADGGDATVEGALAARFGEVCDDGNNDDGDGCRADCAGVEACGDGLLDAAAGEVCDDGNNDDGDGCSAVCRIEPTCGNDILEDGEVCDDGNRDAGDGCRADCRGLEECGDGLVDPVAGEQCDDGNDDDDDGCDSSCNLDAFINVPPVLVSGAHACTTQASNTGRKIAVDELGTFHVAMLCDGEVRVAASSSRGVTWTTAATVGIAGAVEVAIEGGPAGVVYVAAIAGNDLVFTRSVDGGTSWEASRVLRAGIGDAEVSLDAHEDGVWIAVSSGNVEVLRNGARGAGEFAGVSLAMANVFHEVIVDKISGDVWALSDDPAFHVRRSVNGGASFAAEVTPPGQAYFSDWAGSRGFLYVVGTDLGDGATDIDVIPMAAPETGEAVDGLPTIATSQARAIDADPLGNAYVVSQLDGGAIQLDRMVFASGAIAPQDVRTIAAAGAWPAVAGLPSSDGAVVAFTVGASVFVGVVVY